MNVLEPSVEILTPINGLEVLKMIELAGRTCYRSEANITDESCKAFVNGIISRGHLSVIEHVSITFRIICDRAVTHELVRHRLASYSQESQRYCNYNKKGMSFIKPSTFDMWDEYRQTVWFNAMRNCEDMYNKLIEAGCKPEEARSVLPNSTKTEIVVTMNLRELRHFLLLRTSKAAHPDMRAVALELLKQLKEKVPVVFDDITA